MLSLFFPKPVLLPGRVFAMVSPYHLWVFLDGAIIHLPGNNVLCESHITRFIINDSRIRFNEYRAKLKLKFAKFSYGLIGGAIYVAPKLVILLNTRNFDKYIVLR